MCRKEKLAPEGADGHTTTAAVLSVNILVARRIIQLSSAGLDEYVIIGEFAVINLRPRYLEAPSETGGISLMKNSGSPSGVT